MANNSISGSLHLKNLPKELVGMIFTHCVEELSKVRRCSKWFQNSVDEYCKTDITRRVIEHQIQYILNTENNLVKAFQVYTLFLVNRLPFYSWETVEAFGEFKLSKEIKFQLSLKALSFMNLTRLVVNSAKEAQGAEDSYKLNHAAEFSINKAVERYESFYCIKILFMASILSLTQKREKFFWRPRMYAVDFFNDEPRKLESCDPMHLKGILCYLKACIIAGIRIEIDIFEKMRLLKVNVESLALDIDSIFTEIALCAKEKVMRQRALIELIHPRNEYRALCSNEALIKALQELFLEKDGKGNTILLGKGKFDYNARDYVLSDIISMALSCNPLRHIGVGILKRIIDENINIYDGVTGEAFNGLIKVAKVDNELKFDIFGYIKASLSDKFADYFTVAILKGLKEIAEGSELLKEELILFLKEYLNVDFTKEVSYELIKKSVTAARILLSWDDVELLDEIVGLFKKIILIGQSKESMMYILRVSVLEELGDLAIRKDLPSLVSFFKDLFLRKIDHIDAEKYSDVALDCLKQLSVEYECLRGDICQCIKSAIREDFADFDYNNVLLDALYQIEVAATKSRTEKQNKID